MLARVERIKSRLQSYLASAKDVYTRIVENLDGTQLMMPSTAVYLTLGAHAQRGLQ
jgi:hypothetical protein